MKNGLTTLTRYLFLFKSAKNLGQSEDAKQRKKKGGLSVMIKNINE